MSLTLSTHEEAEKCTRDCYIKVKRYLRCLDVDGKTILTFALNTYNVKVFIRFKQLWVGFNRTASEYGS